MNFLNIDLRVEQAKEIEPRNKYREGGATQQSGESHRCRVTLYILYRAVCKMGYKLTSILFEMTSLNC